MIKAIFFDFDGTLVDTAPGIVATMREVFKAMGTTMPSEEAMRATIGLHLVDALAQLGGYDAADAHKAVNLYRQFFEEYELGNLSVYPQVMDTLEQFRAQGVRMAIVTSRDDNSLNLILKPRDMERFFETRVTGSDGLKPKPAPDPVLALLSRMNLHADEVLVVGDTTYDIGMGNNAHCRTCAVTYGNHSRQQLLSESPTFVIDTFADLLSVVAEG